MTYSRCLWGEFGFELFGNLLDDVAAGNGVRKWLTPLARVKVEEEPIVDVTILSELGEHLAMAAGWLIALWAIATAI